MQDGETPGNQSVIAWSFFLVKAVAMKLNLSIFDDTQKECHNR